MSKPLRQRSCWPQSKSKHGALILAFSGLIAACGAPIVAAPTSDAQLVEGQNVYTNQCASCHRADGSGGTGKQLSEGRVLAAYADAASQVEFVKVGKGQMPAYSGRLTDAEIEAVVRYTREVLNDAGEGE